MIVFPGRVSKKTKEPKKSIGREGQTHTHKQTGNKTNKHTKKFQVQEQKSFSLSSSGVTPSASSPGACI
jgi:hypothetical protein